MILTLSVHPQRGDHPGPVGFGSLTAVSTHRSSGPDLFAMCKVLDAELTQRCRVALDAAGYPAVLPSQWRLLRLLTGEARLTVELAAIMGITNQGVSKLSNHLIDLGLAAQRFDPSDHRLRPLTLTTRGHRALKILTATADQLRLELASGPGGEESLLTTLVVLQQLTKTPAITTTAA